MCVRMNDGERAYRGGDLLGKASLDRHEDEEGNATKHSELFEKNFNNGLAEIIAVVHSIARSHVNQDGDDDNGGKDSCTRHLSVSRRAYHA
jgi:hypothetical protein